MSSISAISNTVLKRTIPFCPHNKISITLLIKQKISVKNHVNRSCLPSLLIMASGDPTKYPTRIPPEIPSVPPSKHSVPLDVPPLTTRPEVDPGEAPSEVKENPPLYETEPRPEIEFPKPPVSPNPKPDVPPMPAGPDILPPDRQPGPEIDPPRTPPPDIPPVRLPGPEIVPPPNLPPDITPPPGSPFGDFGFTI